MDMSTIEKKHVSDMLISYHEHFSLAIPGNQTFNRYTFKSQLGIMKGHIFCSLFGIGPKNIGKCCLKCGIKENYYGYI